MPTRIDVDEIMERLGALKAKLPEAVLVAVRADVADAVRYAVRDQLSGQKLRRRTGTLQRSVAASPRIEPSRIDSPSRITGVIGTSLGYGKAHEEGFAGTVQVRAHARRKVAVRRSSTGKVTQKSIRRLKALSGRGNVVYVNAHDMRVNIRAKLYLRDSVRAVEPKLHDYAMRAIAFLGRTGKVPTLSAIRGGGGA
jgi:hypothetical protein